MQLSLEMVEESKEKDGVKCEGVECDDCNVEHFHINTANLTAFHIRL